MSPADPPERRVTSTMTDLLAAAARRYLSPRTRMRIRGIQRAVLGRRNAHGLAAARASLGSGHVDEAAGHVEVVLAREPTDTAALALAAKIASRRGDVAAAARHAVRRLEQTGETSDWIYAREAVGRARETDSRWQPVVWTPTGAPTPAERTARIIYLAKESRPFLHNGFCTRSHETLRALVRSGRDMVGVTMPGFPGTVGVEDAPAESVVEEVTYRHLLPRAGTRLRALAPDEHIELTARMLAGVVSRERPALLHVSSGHRGFEAALAATAVARWAGIPWLYEVRSFFETTWTSDQTYAEHSDYYERRFATESRMMAAADVVVTLSGPMRDEIVRRHGIPAGKVRVIPNAVDSARFTPKERDPALRRKLGLTDSFTLGYVSNLAHPREGQEVLIHAVARLRSQGRAVTGLLVGDGARRAELERLAHKAGVAGHVTFTGNVPFDEVAGHYAQIDLFVVPRVDDRAARMVSPLKPFEAMAMRVPLLVSDLPALHEIVGGSERGQVFRAGDPVALAAAAAGLMDDDGERRRLVESASAWVASERSWTGVADAFGEVYDTLLHGGLGGTAHAQPAASGATAPPSSAGSAPPAASPGPSAPPSAPAPADTTAEEIRAC